METTELCREIRILLADKKAIDPMTLDVRGLSNVTDFFVIATATSPPHLRALAEDLEVTLKHRDSPVYRRSGEPESGWIVLDYVDVVVHVFSAEMREYYALEKLWADAVVV